MELYSFDDNILEEFITKFYGYGNYDGDYWFVGLEQGGGNSFAEVQQRLDIWVQNNKPELEDAAVYHKSIGLGHFFDDKKPKQQSTWARLIRTIYGVEGASHKDVSAKHVNMYQRDEFLRLNSNSCSIELLPLPSPSMNDWIYAQHSSLDYLKSRALYRKQFAERRAEIINTRIMTHQPKLVMFYGLHPEYVYWWKKIADQPFEEKNVTTKFKAEFAFNGDTVFVISRHPVAFGSTNEYWHNLGQIVETFIN